MRPELEHSDDFDDDGLGPSDGKRPRLGTGLVKELMTEIEMRKAQKVKEREEPRGSNKKTLAEIEAEEGGPIKESAVAMAHVKRAQAARKAQQGAADDTEIAGDVEQFEEEQEAQEEDGVKFTAFNLNEERETGYFDDDGNFVERKDKDEAAKDAWFASDEAKVISGELRRKIEERRKAEEEAERASKRAAPLTDRQIAALKMELVQHMQPKETLSRAMKRLGGGQAARAMGKRERQRLQQQQQAAGGAAAGNAAILERIIEITDQLLNEGETDVYEVTKEDLESSAAMWLPKDYKPPTAAAATNGGGAAPAAPAAAAKKEQDDADDDMFAEDDESPAAAPAAPAPQQQEAAPAAAAAPSAEPSAAPAAASGASAPAQEQQQQQGSAEATDYSSWPVKELKRFLQERGVDASSFTEKAELVAKVREVAAKGPEGADAFSAPPGYVFDPTTNMFFSAESGMYYDPNTQGFCHNGQWFSYDSASGQYVPWAQ